MKRERPGDRDASTPCQVLIVDAHPIVRQSLRDLVDSLEGTHVCGEAPDAWAAMALMWTTIPDLVLLDVGHFPRRGLDRIGLMLEKSVGLKIAVLSDEGERREALQALRAGARGYLSKRQSRDALRDGIQEVIEGERYLCPPFAEDRVFQMVLGVSKELRLAIQSLSPREAQVFREMGGSDSTVVMAASLGISVKTLETHRIHMIEKLGVEGALPLRQLAQECADAAMPAEAGNRTEFEMLSEIGRSENTGGVPQELATADTTRA